MSVDLAGRVVLVTGAAGGLGAAQARLLAGCGAKVVLADTAEVKALVDELNDGHAEPVAAGVPLDVRQAEQWAAAVSRSQAVFGHLDGLVNNAGVLGVGAVADLPEAEFRRIVDVNQVGVFLGIQAVVPAMRTAGGGTIVNISSIDAMIGFRYLSAYCASKAAVSAISRTAAMELGPDGIRVNAVCPGVIGTPMTEELDANVSGWLHRTLPLRRLGTAPEVATVVAYLTSADSSYVTGTEIVVDGGLLAGFLLP
ncbi:glucose 1-dehydrogenase [Amorphoplanes nipponensis]|uniref:Short-chain dehydrogenase/reductase n=1 Tax=Actinoplanes nipponensis TaxID=135950 RepID=A0A919JBK1_9ACTN|nr:SDR family NAD(P)-dependent oxidoreductase [Actinoplanes nipponensis]GIE47351.1 putative short-chain dehydrogenase/reductase [Actinoplanes nipponensis]